MYLNLSQASICYLSKLQGFSTFKNWGLICYNFQTIGFKMLFSQKKISHDLGVCKIKYIDSWDKYVKKFTKRKEVPTNIQVGHWDKHNYQC